MPSIVLTTLNAKFIHAAFGLRYLLANLGALRSRADILEFDISQRPIDITESLLARNPKIIGFGVYIWNVAPTTEVVALIKRLRPDIVVVLGGPEVSYEIQSQTIVQSADYVIPGEGDLAFRIICGRLLAGERPATKVILAELPQLEHVALPYDLYSDQDIAHRVIYVEASRGCPFTCEFCLSSLDIPVRQFPLPRLLEQLDSLLSRGVKQLKFVDRTFNLNAQVSGAILRFLRERYQPGHFFHFEMIPDRLAESLRAIIASFPPGALQFEVGIQTFNQEVSALISRRQNYDRLQMNFQFLREQTGVHIHADLIAGLPGEDLRCFAAGFDRLLALGPQEIQVGILKRLRGTPISRHDQEWEMIYSPHPPYEIMQNKLIDFATMQKLRRFARYWDLVGNSGNFRATRPLIWTKPAGPGEPAIQLSPFDSFLRFTDWLYARERRTDSIALVRLMSLLFEFLTQELGHNQEQTAGTIWCDYRQGGRYDKPSFLKQFLSDEEIVPLPNQGRPTVPKRQARHLAS